MHPHDVERAMKELRAKRDEITKQLKSIADACTHDGTTVTYSTGVTWCKACKRHIVKMDERGRLHAP